MRKTLATLALALLTVLPAPAEEPVETLRYSQLVPLAMERNLGLRSQSMDLEQSRARVEIAEGQRNPTLGIQSTFVVQDPNLLRSLIPRNDGQLMLNQLSLQIPVYTGGRLESAIHEREALVEVDQHNLERGRQELAFRSKETFLQALLAREEEEVARQTLAESQETERQAEARRKAGSGTKFDVLQAQVAVSTARQQITQSHTANRSAQANLANLLHYPVDTRFEMPDTLMAPQIELEPLAGTDLKSLTVVALDRRPELAALRARLKANEEAAHGAESGLKPQFNLAVNYALLGSPADLQGGWQVMAQVSLPLFDGGVTDARLHELEARKGQLEIEQERQVDQVALDVQQSLLKLQDAQARLETTQQQVEEAREAVRLARIRFQAGAGTSLELITAQANAAQAQFALAESRYRQMHARAQLNLALGVAGP